MPRKIIIPLLIAFLIIVAGSGGLSIAVAEPVLQRGPATATPESTDEPIRAEPVLSIDEGFEEAEEIDADVVLTECNSCVHNLGNAKFRAQKFRIYTTTEFINHLLDEAG